MDCVDVSNSGDLDERKSWGWTWSATYRFVSIP
jgi:hypothetical protein